MRQVWLPGPARDLKYLTCIHVKLVSEEKACIGHNINRPAQASSRARPQGRGRPVDVLARIRDGICNGDPVASLVEEALLAHTAPDILDGAVIPGIREAGRLWDEGIYFLPDVIMATESFKEAMQLMEAGLAAGEISHAGKYLIGVVEGDVHDLGKSIVAAMLTSGGFEVVDLGSNVSVRTFVEKVREHEPDILGIGAYMSTTMLIMREVIEALEAGGLREKVKVMVGGVPITPQYAEDVGADGFGRDAMEALHNALKIVGAEP